MGYHLIAHEAHIAHRPTLALQIPAQVSTLTYTQNGMLILGSADGSIRLYRPPDTKVVRAIRGLDSEVSSVAAVTPTTGTFGHIWVACGCLVSSVVEAPPGACQRGDTQCSGHSDVTNEISVSENEKTLAFSMDSGAVGVVDLVTNNIRRMETQHNSICAVVRFIPDRPSELVSGGYDSTLLHFDFGQRTILSRREFTSLPQSSDVSLSPPFTAVYGLVLGDDKRLSVKRTRKWGGLREDMSLSKKIADGPIVAVAFLDPSVIVTSTLLGVISRHTLSTEGSTEDWRLESTRVAQTPSIAKVNALAVHDRSVVVGGFQADGTGTAEVYRHEIV
ncbi:WD40 repeat-like protein [Russula earlei]|uniref:WD40 repeat-like protein n=1 Tax=Russula earlei TaxID=71964 RepID=A0ACC0UE36_9AGAM|nr:WD40 repeat-like protein [Russula earlei]